jgi:hypothetical protein
MKKLIIITVRFRQRVNQKLVEATFVNGKATVPEFIIIEMARELGAGDGQTIQIG